MTFAEKIFEARWFCFRRDFTDDVFNRVLNGETIRFTDKKGVSDVAARLARGGILLQTWHAHIAIHHDDIAKGHDHVMALYEEQMGGDAE